MASHGVKIPSNCEYSENLKNSPDHEQNLWFGVINIKADILAYREDDQKHVVSDSKNNSSYVNQVGSALQELPNPSDRDLHRDVREHEDVDQAFNHRIPQLTRDRVWAEQVPDQQSAARE